MAGKHPADNRRVEKGPPERAFDFRKSAAWPSVSGYPKTSLPLREHPQQLRVRQLLR